MASASTWPPVLGRGDAAASTGMRRSSCAGAGPGAGGRQADRRTLGHRPGRLPARANSPAAGSNGTTAFATRMRAFWLERRWHTRRLRAAAVRVVRPVRSRAAARQPESVNYVVSHDGFTLARPGELRAQAQRSQRRGQPRRPWPQPAAGTAASKARATTLRCWRCARRLQRALLATLLLAQGTPMLAAGDELRPQPGRQQQPLLPGQRHHLDRLGRRTKP